MNDRSLSAMERIATLEAEHTQVKQDLNEIKTKLDELLHLKSKGYGALWLIGILVLAGSGIVSFINNFISLFPKHH